MLPPACPTHTARALPLALALHTQCGHDPWPRRAPPTLHRRISGIVFPDQAENFVAAISKGKGAKKGDLDMTAAQRAHILADKDAADAQLFDNRMSTFGDDSG